MRPTLFLFPLAACALALCGHLRAQPPAMPYVGNVDLSADYEWRAVKDEFALLHAGKQIGSYRPADGLYFALVGEEFAAEASKPPLSFPEELLAGRKCGCCKGCACKAKKCGCTSAKRCTGECKCAKVIGAAGGCACTGEVGECHCPLDCRCGPTCVKNYGVQRKEISTQERYTINGHVVTKKAMEEALTADPATPIGNPDVAIPDDSAKLSLTIIGSEDERKRVLTDLQTPAFTAFREHVLVQDYAPDSPMLKPGFVTAGHPTIYLQKPDGAVLARVDHYDGPQTIEAVRKTDPLYKPDADPDPTKPKPAPTPAPAPSPDGGGVSGGAIAAAIGGLLCFGLFAVGCLIGFVLLVRAAMRRAAA